MRQEWRGLRSDAKGWRAPPTRRRAPLPRPLLNYDSRFSKIEADLLVLKWMVGFILAGVASLVVKTFVA